MLGIEIRNPTSTPTAPTTDAAYRRYLLDGMTKGFAVSQHEAPEDRGTLSETAVPPEWRGDRIVWAYTQPYAAAQEEGTDPYLAPFDPLLEWAERQNAESPWGLASYVWKKIAREGIEPKGYMDAGAEAAVDWFQTNDFGRYLEEEFE